MSTPLKEQDVILDDSVADETAVFGQCPMPIFDHPQIVLGHGSGGKLSAELIEKVFLSRFANPTLECMNDSALLEIGEVRLAFTTDSFVVTPIFFPGGDIGSLAVNGTVNDLAMAGAKPLYLSAAFILEEGLLTEDLTRVVDSMQSAASRAGVQLVTGDTKVVNRGKGDQIFIVTTGIGLVPVDVQLSADRARPGDKVLLSGFIGDHGITILSQRENLEFEGDLRSDCAALNDLVDVMLDEVRAAGTPAALRCLRDPTRGGIASTLNEIATRSGVGDAAGRGYPCARDCPRSMRDARTRSAVCRERGQADRSGLRGSGTQRAKAYAESSAGRREQGDWPNYRSTERHGSDENLRGRNPRCRHAFRGTTASNLLSPEAPMHELSIALSMIEQIEFEAERHGDAVVEAVYVRIGVLSGVDTQALSFAYEIARAGTSVAGSRLEIETVPLSVYCPQCKSTHSPDPQQITCPHCLTPPQEILAGRELEIRALELSA